MVFTVLEQFDLALLPGNCSLEVYRDYPVPQPAARRPPGAKLAWGETVWLTLADGTSLRMNVGPLPNEYDMALELFLIDVASGAAPDSVEPIADWLIAERVPIGHVEHRAHVDRHLGNAAFAKLGERIAQRMREREEKA